jgi:DNA-binding XRE family transcriptional regulator
MQAWISEQSTPQTGTATILSMRKATTPAQYRAKFFERVRAARNMGGHSPAEMARLLDVPKDTYHRYESRVLMPHHLIPQFCQLNGVEVEWLVRGGRREEVQAPQKQAVRDVA